MHEVILVEDEKDLGDIYVKIFEKKKVPLTLCRNENSFLKVLEEGDPVIIFLDHSIGSGRTGIELIPEVKKKHPKARIIIFSNYSDFAMRHVAIRGGADEYIVKLDISVDEMVDKINEEFVRQGREPFDSPPLGV